MSASNDNYLYLYSLYIKCSQNRRAPSSVFSSLISQTLVTPFPSVPPRETPKKSAQRELVSEAMVIKEQRQVPQKRMVRLVLDPDLSFGHAEFTS